MGSVIIKQALWEWRTVLVQWRLHYADHVAAPPALIGRPAARHRVCKWGCPAEPKKQWNNSVPRQPDQLGFVRFRWVFTGFPGFYWVLLGSTGFYWVEQRFTRFDQWVQVLTGLYWVLTGFYWVVQRFTGFYQIEQVSHGFYWVTLFFSLDFTGFYWALLGFNRSHSVL